MNIPKWKASSTNSVIPTNSRPFHNKDPNLASVARVAFKPNPIKHWRKQLKPYYKTTSSKQVSINMVNAPGSVNHINNTDPECSTNNYQLLKENINLLSECDGIKSIIDGSVRCTGGTNHITRTANTKISKKYHVSHAKYLQSKCKTYERNLMLGEKVSDNTYNPISCNSALMSCKKPVIYKPSNQSFQTQGAVSASAKILKTRNQTLSNNTHSLKTAYGNAPVFAKQYTTTSGYTIKYIKGNLNDNSRLCNQTFKSCKKA